MRQKTITTTLALLLAVSPVLPAQAVVDPNFSIEIIPAASTPGGGGGGGGSTLHHTTGISFSGRAYANQPVIALKDGIKLLTTMADQKGDFRVSFEGATPGFYNFILYADDKGGERSILYTIPTEIRRGMTTQIDGILIPPTIRLTNTQVKVNGSLNVYGYGMAGGELIISTAGKDEIVQADTLGKYEENIDLTGLQRGEYQVKAKTTGDGMTSETGKVVRFAIGDANVKIASPICPEKGDLNSDCFVNISDFSIATYWLGKTLPTEELIRNRIDQDGDEKITLKDFSIIAYYWTG